MQIKTFKYSEFESMGDYVTELDYEIALEAGGTVFDAPYLVATFNEVAQEVTLSIMLISSPSHVSGVCYPLAKGIEYDSFVMFSTFGMQATLNSLIQQADHNK